MSFPDSPKAVEIELHFRKFSARNILSLVSSFLLKNILFYLIDWLIHWFSWLFSGALRDKPSALQNGSFPTDGWGCYGGCVPCTIHRSEIITYYVISIRSSPLRAISEFPCFGIVEALSYCSKDLISGKERKWGKEMRGGDCKERISQNAHYTVSAVGREKEVSFKEQTKFHCLIYFHFSPPHRPLKQLTVTKCPFKWCRAERKIEVTSPYDM